MQPPVTYCDCCGLPISPQSGVDCPRCGYPIIADKEERFLASALRDLQRVANHGGANLTVAGLMRRYGMRLNYLRQVKAALIPAKLSAFSQLTPSEVVSTTHPAPLIPAQTPLPHVAPIPPQTPRSELVPVNPPLAPLASMPAATPPVQEHETTPRPAFSFSLRSFVVDQAITIIGLLGAFLILIGALSSVVTTTNPLQSFLIVFGVHAFFGIGGAVAFRFPNSRLIARIYTGIYTLLVPLVGFTGYSLIQGNIIHLSVPTLITISAIYAAIAYILLAIYQRFSLFGYLGAMALVVTDLAIARDLNLGYWWWPSMLMLLALPSLFSLSTHLHVFTGTLAVLRDPVRILMYTIVGICVLGTLFATLTSISPAYFALPDKELRFSILLMSLLVLLWTSLFLWLIKNTRALLVLAYILLACVLAFCYAFDFAALGYALAFTCVALFYYGLNRFARRPLQPFGLLGLGLDQLALILVSIVPFLSSLLLPQQLLFKAYHLSLLATSPLYMQTLWNWNTIAELIAVIAGLILTFSVTLARANQSEGTHTQGNYWPWLLLLSGFLLNWAYSVVILVTQVEPVWYFLGLTLLVLALAVLVRQRFGASWANPLDVLAIAETLLTLGLSLSQNAQSISSLLLLFAALSYAVILYQRRQNLLFLPFTFAVLALPALLSVGPYTVPLLLGVLLPFASVAIHHLMPAKAVGVGLSVSSAGVQRTSSSDGRADGIAFEGAPENPLSTEVGESRVRNIWEWPLLTIGLLYGIVVCLLDMIAPESTVHNWLGITFPVALEMATLSLAWYGATALVRVKWWLIPVLGFAIAAVLLPTNFFWVLLWVVPVAALLALAISRFVGKIWASPLYTVALLGVAMIGYTGYYQDHRSATTWALLAFALLAYFIGVIEDLDVSLWLAPVIAIWSVYDSATLLGDLYRPPTIALICATFGIAIGLLRLSPLPVLRLMRSKRFLRYSLPFYTTALASAVLTGIYGVLAGVNYPFFAAIPDALLLYAAVAFGVVFFERRPEWLGLVAAFGIWAALMTPQTRAPYVAGIALGASLLGLLTGHYIKQSVTPTQSQTALQTFTKFTWGWPWYLIALVAALITGIWPVLSPFPLPGGFKFIEYSLLAFAVLAYIIGFIEDMLPWLWIAPIFATWSLIDAAAQGDYRSLFIIALVCVTLGVATSCLKFIPRLLPVRPGKTLLGYAMPFYATALVAAGLTGIDGTRSNTDHLFYFVALLLYAALCYAVLLFERQPKFLALVAGLAVWATGLATQITTYHMAALALGLGIVGLLVGLIIRRSVINRETPTSLTSLNQFTWNWPWYITALVAAVVTSLWPFLPLAQPATGFIGYSLLAITVLSLLIMLVERTPELLVFPVGLATLTIWQWQPHLDLPSLMIAYSLLSVLIFASQFVWTLPLPSIRWLPPTMLHRVLALGTQTLIVLIICGNGGLSADSGLLAFVGAGSLFVLAFLVFWYGHLQQNVTLQRYCDYTAGLLLSLVIPWTLSAFRQTNLNLLMLAPATYLTIIAPILMRDDSLPEHQQLGQVVALSGTALLLLSTLWLSFTNSDANLLYTLILLGESILLLLLGIGLGMRVFVLSGTGLIVVGALHALFLPTLGIPTPLAMTILGGTLLAVATALSLVRRRLQAAWIHWE